MYNTDAANEAWDRAFEQAEQEFKDKDQWFPCRCSKCLTSRAEQIIDKWADAERFKGT